LDVLLKGSLFVDQNNTHKNQETQCVNFETTGSIGAKLGVKMGLVDF